jgi:hypothetical protein
LVILFQIQILFQNEYTSCVVIFLVIITFSLNHNRIYGHVVIILIKVIKMAVTKDHIWLHDYVRTLVTKCPTHKNHILALWGPAIPPTNMLRRGPTWTTKWFIRRRIVNWSTWRGSIELFPTKRVSTRISLECLVYTAMPNSYLDINFSSTTPDEKDVALSNLHGTFVAFYFVLPMT